MSFLKRQDFLDMLRQAFSNVEIESLDHIETNQDPQALFFSKPGIFGH